MNPEDYPLKDGPSFAHDVRPLEEEIRKGETHLDWGIDLAACRAALEEAKADAARAE